MLVSWFIKPLPEMVHHFFWYIPFPPKCGKTNIAQNKKSKPTGLDGRNPTDLGCMKTLVKWGFQLPTSTGHRRIFEPLEKPPSCESVDIAWIAWKGLPQIDVLYVYMGVSLKGPTTIGFSY